MRSILIVHVIMAQSENHYALVAPVMEVLLLPPEKNCSVLGILIWNWFFLPTGILSVLSSATTGQGPQLLWDQAIRQFSQNIYERLLAFLTLWKGENLWDSRESADNDFLKESHEHLQLQCIASVSKVVALIEESNGISLKLARNKISLIHMNNQPFLNNAKKKIQSQLDIRQHSPSHATDSHQLLSAQLVDFILRFCHTIYLCLCWSCAKIHLNSPSTVGVWFFSRNQFLKNFVLSQLWELSKVLL